MTEEEIKKLAVEYVDNCTKKAGFVILAESIKSDFIDLFVAGFMKCQELKAKSLQWHKVSEKLPEMDVLVYLWNKIDDFPVVARRHIPYGQKKWLWDCKWGIGFTISQLIGEDYLWKEIVLPELPKE